jgi:hypothetical protein
VSHGLGDPSGCQQGCDGEQGDRAQACRVVHAGLAEDHAHGVGSDEHDAADQREPLGPDPGLVRRHSPRVRPQRGVASASVRRKEAYVGSWLPEPLVTAPDVAGDVELAESVSMALMLVVETLSPIERAVFALREAFDVSHDEIAAAVDKSPAAVRQIAHRARRHVDARRPHRVVSPSEARADLESFQRGSKPGTSRAFLTYPPLRSSLWPTAAESSRPRCGRSRVPRRLPASPSVVSAESKARSPLSVNGSSAMVIRLDGEVGGVMVIPVEGCPYHRSSL